MPAKMTKSIIQRKTQTPPLASKNCCDSTRSVKRSKDPDATAMCSCVELLAFAIASGENSTNVLPNRRKPVNGKP
jgi:hypothetical protein